MVGGADEEAPLGWIPRLAAAVIAAAAWGGLIVQFMETHALVRSAVVAASIMLRFFTITTNLIAAILFTGVALGVRRFGSPRLLASAALWLGLVGVVNALLLRGLAHNAGWAVADTLLHDVTPVLAPAFWAVFARKGALRIADTVWFAFYPLAYLAFALVRGALYGLYPYPFLNVGKLGGMAVLSNVGLIALGFIAAGVGMLALDAALGRRTSLPPA